jgi:hypothetical protein
LVLVWCFFRIPKGGPNFSESFHFSCKLKLGSSWLDTRPLLQKKGQKLLSPFEPLGLPAQPCSLDCLQIFFFVIFHVFWFSSRALLLAHL